MRILIAGAGGLLGRELVNIFSQRGMEVVGLGYSAAEFHPIKDKLTQVFCCDVTQPEQLKGICRGIDMVISLIGITRMKANLTHMAVDYQGNLNLLNAAKKRGVKKFIFISPAGVDKGHNYVPLFRAKYLFEQELIKSGLDWLIFRSGGFFRDLAEMARMAQKGMMFVLGDGSKKFTPIDVRELAQIMAEDTLHLHSQIVEVGGPLDMDWREICEACFSVFEKKPFILSLPLWFCRLSAALLRPFSPKYFAMARLLIFTSSIDLPTQRRGRLDFKHYLKDYYQKTSQLAKCQSKNM